MGKLPGIQLARAIAALSVCYFHSWSILDRFPKGTANPIPWLAQNGWVGVDIFFAISGFVVALQAAKPTFGAADFLVRRIVRIYPLWWATLTTFAVLALAWRTPRESESFGFFFYSATLLPTEHYPFYDIGWSLQHEMLFYLISAAIVPFAGLFGLVAFLAAGAAASPLLPPIAQGFVVYYPLFITGIIAFVLLGYTRRLGAMALLMLGIALLAIFLEWGGRPYFPIPLFFIISGFAAMRTAVCTSLGDASYSIYLIHPVTFDIAKAATIPVLGSLWLQEPIRWASILLVVALSILCYRFLEKPINEFARRQLIGLRAATV